MKKLFILLLTSISCTGLGKPFHETLFDYIPPRLINFTQEGNRLVFEFDEELSGGSISISPQVAPLGEPVLEGPRLTEIIPEAYVPGREFTAALEVRDTKGNTMVILHKFFTLNPTLAQVRLSELRIAGDAQRPDLVEMEVIASGSLLGMEIRDGPGNDRDAASFIFPGKHVEAGDRILVHFKPAGTPGEVQEIESKTQSTALGSSPTAWDYWVPGAQGLAGANGIVILLDRPWGPGMDGVIYSNRTSSSDTAYKGFGSKAFLNSAHWLVEQGFWKPQGQQIRPEDCVDSTKTTAARTLARYSDQDTDSSSDWYTAASGTPGSINTGISFRYVRRG